jgi:hypothetical protein
VISIPRAVLGTKEEIVTSNALFVSFHPSSCLTRHFRICSMNAMQRDCIAHVRVSFRLGGELSFISAYPPSNPLSAIHHTRHHIGPSNLLPPSYLPSST